MKNQIVFLPGLNGIRTIAALGVLFSHINLALLDFGIDNFSLFGYTNEGKLKGWMLGGHGVTMFFVLSGFLITYLLLKEFEKTNTIDIKKFYMRRILRIWPLYFFYVLLTLVVMWNQINIDFNLVYYLTFFANIPFIQEHGYMGMLHLWSIGVEEQFYLFWPLLFVFFIRRNIFIRITSIIIMLFLIFRIMMWYFFPFSEIALFSSVNRFDCMLFGGLGAYLYYNKVKSLISLIHIWRSISVGVL
ncbi:acyltransferase family protein [Sphingobacterium sp. UDSM-2020]|uniref:acyltransferase family protein n=1 Tax=Sphingobacterium sp. UDSM-2020 TaxID=2795738 RepID=UPI0019354F50|nr:acyltransferase [Sphingobacterium sp. UDSM-2020]QQD15386.1 acyltransferase [Sphingobacterium sp. UDSM-2020]